MEEELIGGSPMSLCCARSFRDEQQSDATVNNADKEANRGNADGFVVLM